MMGVLRHKWNVVLLCFSIGICGVVMSILFSYSTVTAYASVADDTAARLGSAVKMGTVSLINYIGLAESSDIVISLMDSVALSESADSVVSLINSDDSAKYAARAGSVDIADFAARLGLTDYLVMENMPNTADDNTDITDTATIYITGEHEYKAVRLNSTVYSQSNRSLSDLLILDERGVPVPYFIHAYEAIQEGEHTSYTLIQTDSFIKDGDSYEDYQIIQPEGMDILATSLSIQSESVMFAKNIELWGSYDGLAWDFIKYDTLYRVGENEKLNLTLADPLKYNHYRIRVKNNIETDSYDFLKIGKATLHYSYNISQQVHFTDYMNPRYTIEHQEHDTVIRLFDLKNVRISQLSIQTGSQFKRAFRFADNRSKTLYNLTVGDSSYQDLTLNFDGFREESDVVELRIANGDDTPIHITGMELSYFTDELIFKGENEQAYTLSFGNPADTTAPSYDIVNYKDLILEAGYDVVAIDNFILTQAEAEPEEVTAEAPDNTMAFHIVVIVVAVLLGFVIFIRLKITEG